MMALSYNRTLEEFKFSLCLAGSVTGILIIVP